MNKQNDGNASYAPFRRVSGALGCLWRTLVFLFGLAMLCLLLAQLPRGCRPDGPHPLRDSSLVREWRDSIPGVPELPAPDDNFIPPVDSTRIIVNPEDSLSYILCDQLNVFFNSQNLKQDMADFARKFKQAYPSDGYEIVYYNATAGTMILSVPRESLMQVAEELPQKIAEPDFIVAPNEILAQCGKPADPGFGEANYDAYFRLIQAYDAWDITKGSPEVKVAVVDSYFDLTNPEIGERYVDPIYIPTSSGNVLPPSVAPTSADITAYCHGSHVAGIAIGAQNNKLGCSGIAPACSWIPVALGDQLTSFNIIEGILYAVYRGADVVNFSLGRAFPPGVESLPLEKQVERAVRTDRMGERLWEYIVETANDHRCVLCSSAGNESILMGMDPKKRSMRMIKVEAVDNEGRMASFSNFGKVPEAGLDYSTVSAPGVDLWSVSDKRCAPLLRAAGDRVSPDGFQEMSGTSMASPVVAGAVALLKSKNRNLTTEQVIKILTMTARQFDKQSRIGPTIQLRDALNATGGDLANFDDLMADHDRIIGKWRSTHELAIGPDDRPKEKIDDIWTYFIFTSSTAGRIEHHAVNKRTVYSAGLSVRWGADKIEIMQLGPATTPEGDKLLKDDFVCTPDANRLLNATCIKPGRGKAFGFQLEKVN